MPVQLGSDFTEPLFAGLLGILLNLSLLIPLEQDDQGDDCQEHDESQPRVPPPNGRSSTKHRSGPSGSVSVTLIGVWMHSEAQS